MSRFPGCSRGCCIDSPSIARARTRRWLAELLSALGQGHQAALCDLRGLDHPHAEPRQEGQGGGGRDGWFRRVFDNLAAAVAIGDTEGTPLEVTATATMSGTRPSPRSRTACAEVCGISTVWRADRRRRIRRSHPATGQHVPYVGYC